ncbi:MAG: hypothetical protein JWO86_8532 [Myxococcaceae bacterium]|nr:hypothetical protein [Myxococcaceae bacterium]
MAREDRRARDSSATRLVTAPLAAFRRTAALDSVSFSCVGQDLGNPKDGFTHAYVVGIADLAALDRYLSDPIHRAGDFVIVPHLARLARTALSDDLDPALGAKVGVLWTRRVAADKEWLGLFDRIAQLSL